MPWMFRRGRLYIEAGGASYRLFGRWDVPDGLHLSFGNRGVHLFWSPTPPGALIGHVTFDYIDPKAFGGDDV